MKEKDLAQEIANVKSTVNQVKDAEGVTFKSKAEFEAAVAESINKFVAQKQQADIDQKYAQFEAAPEKVEEGKHIYGGPWCSVHAGGVLRYGVPILQAIPRHTQTNCGCQQRQCELAVEAHASRFP